MKIYFPLALAALLSLTYCSPNPPGADGDPAPTENQGTAVEQDQLDGDGQVTVSQLPDPNISPSQILEENAEAYAKLHRIVKNNIDAINAALDKSKMDDRIKSALRKSYAEVVKYDNIDDIAKSSPQVSAETIVPYINGLEIKLGELDIELKK